MLEFQQDNQFFLFNLTEKPTEPASFFESTFWEKQQRITGSAKGRGTTYFLNTKDLFGVNTALRHYYRGGLWGKFNKDRYRFQSLTETRSIAELQLLNQLHQAGSTRRSKTTLKQESIFPVPTLLTKIQQ